MSFSTASKLAAQAELRSQRFFGAAGRCPAQRSACLAETQPSQEELQRPRD